MTETNELDDIEVQSIPKDAGSSASSVKPCFFSGHKRWMALVGVVSIFTIVLVATLSGRGHTSDHGGGHTSDPNRVKTENEAAVVGTPSTLEPTMAPTTESTMEPTTELTMEPTTEPSLETTCPDLCLDVSQGKTFIGILRPISTAESVKKLYGYNRDNYSFNGDKVVPLVPHDSILFIHQDTSECDLALVIVHDSKEECSSGKARMFISGNLEDSVVQDGRDSPSDTYEYDPNTDETECFWEWGWQSGCQKRTDGIAQTFDRKCMTVSANFIKGINDWKFVPGPLPNDGSANPSAYIDLDKEETLQICQRECQA